MAGFLARQARSGRAAVLSRKEDALYICTLPEASTKRRFAAAAVPLAHNNEESGIAA